jgi:DNA-binding transcriptional ArsR family regulator
MSFPGTDAGRDRPLDPNLAKALSHPLRQRILERLSVDAEASPSQIARLLDAPLANVAYHVRVLLELDCVELVGTRQVRGALEHTYRATAHPWLDAEQWARLPSSFRRQALARTLREIVSDASDAAVAGGFDQPAALVRRLCLRLDEQGWQDIAVLLETCLRRRNRSMTTAPSALPRAKLTCRPSTLRSVCSSSIALRNPPDRGRVRARAPVTTENARIC